MRADLRAEQAVLGSAIQSTIAHVPLLSLLEADFTDLRHRVLAAVLRDMIRNEQRTDVLTVTSELRARGKFEGAGGVGQGGYLHDLVALAPVPQSAGYYAEMIRVATRVRAAVNAAELLTDKLAMEEAGADLDGILTQHRAQLDAIPGVFIEGDDDNTDTVESLLAETFGPERWLTPGLIARGERIVITGTEGLAKSTLSRQVAICVAGGLNPWNGQRVSDGHRVLYIDAENSRMQSHNAYGWIGGRCNRPMIATGWASRIIHKTRNDGCDLPGRDAGWFHQLAAQHSPDLIILGPAYKLMRGDPQKDSDVLGLLQIIDEVRVKHDAAVFIETHSPHGLDGHRPVRPYGSSVWLRWPEVGFGIKPAAHTEFTAENRPIELEVISWRGQREYRDWPQSIQHGTAGQLPWVARDDRWRPSVSTGYQIPDSESAA